MSAKPKETIIDEVTGKSIEVEAAIDDETTQSEEIEANYSGVYTLIYPIMVNGEECTEIAYDFEKLTTKDLLKISRDLKNKGVFVAAEQFDREYLLNLFAKAIDTSKNNIILMDLLRLKPQDLMKITGLSQSFLIPKDTNTSTEDDL